MEDKLGISYPQDFLKDLNCSLVPKPPTVLVYDTRCSWRCCLTTTAISSIEIVSPWVPHTYVSVLFTHPGPFLFHELFSSICLFFFFFFGTEVIDAFVLLGFIGLPPSSLLSPFVLPTTDWASWFHWTT